MSEVRELLVCVTGATGCIYADRLLRAAVSEVQRLGLIDLRNLVQLAEAGAIVMPAAPAFYPMPQKIEEMADYFVARLLDQIGLRLEHPGRWGA